MTAAAMAPTVKGWCPGALRPMASGDGLVVRLRITGGQLTPATARTVAGLARTHGNGLLDLSQRANLQIRGVRPESWPALVAALAALGLLDADAEAEAIRNVVPSPLAGFDPSAPVDGAALAAGLEARLAGDPRLRALPGKFGFLVDEGGILPLDDCAADLRLTGVATADGPRVRVAIGGRADEAAHVATLAPARAVDAAIALAHAFLALRLPDERRMRSLLARVGAEAVAAAAGLLEAGATDGRAPPLRGPSPLAGGGSPPGESGFGAMSALLGWHPEHRLLGVAAPFGRFEAVQLGVLADVAEAAEAVAGAASLRLTPWRAVLVAGIDGDGAAAATALAAAGLIVDGDDPRLAVVACAGRPACDSAARPAREDAAAFAAAAARLPGTGVRLHVSGCAKGCARPHAAAVTLVGRAGGYDLVENGPTTAPPAATGLGRDEILAWLAAKAQKNGEDPA